MDDYSVIENLTENEINELYKDIIETGEDSLLSWASTKFYCKFICECRDGTIKEAYAYSAEDNTGGYYYSASKNYSCVRGYYTWHIDGGCTSIPYAQYWDSCT